MKKTNVSGATGGTRSSSTSTPSISATTSSIRVREPTKNFYGLFRGKFPSRKVGRMIHWESLLERDAVLLFEFSPGVATFREQPWKVNYTLDGRVRRYTPDFEIFLRNGEILIVEVKPAMRLQRPEEARRFARIAEHLAERDIKFRMLTDETIRQPTLLNNLRMLCRYREPTFSSFERRCWYERLHPHSTVTFAHATALFGSINQVWSLIEQQILGADLQTEITENTELKIQMEEPSNEKLYF